MPDPNAFPIDLDFLRRAAKPRDFDVAIVPYGNQTELNRLLEEGYEPMGVLLGPINGPNGPAGMDYVVWLKRKNSPLVKGNA